MFIFQQTFSPTAPVTKANLPEFENALSNKQVQTLLIQNNIDISKLPPIETASSILNLMRNDSKFAQDWQNLTGLDLKSMDLIVNEYRRLEELNSKLMDDANKRIVGATQTTAILSNEATQFTQKEQTDADKRAAVLLKQFGRIRKTGPDST